MAIDQGITTKSETTATQKGIMIAFGTLALYNWIELVIIIHTTFKQKRGLYFWSFVASTSGIFIYTVFFMILNFYKPPNLASALTLAALISVIGWPLMVTGQSFVLYSRLNLLFRNRKLLRGLLIMILFNAVLGHLPPIVTGFGTHSLSPKPWVLPYTVCEHISVTVFLIQENVMSGLYIYGAAKFFQSAGPFKAGVGRRTMNQLILINALILALDITIASVEYAGYYNIQTMFKPAAYAVKLKLEFRILNQLLEITRPTQGRYVDHTADSYPAKGVSLTSGSAPSKYFDPAATGHTMELRHSTGITTKEVPSDEISREEARLQSSGGIVTTRGFEVEHSRPDSDCLPPV